MLFDSLDCQTCKDFELIISDALFNERRQEISELAKSYSFRIVHISQSPNKWIDNGYTAICNAQNKGIAYASGKVCFNIGDGHQFLTKESIERIWHWYEKGFCAQGIFTVYNAKGAVRYKSGKNAGKLDRDIRANFVERGDGCYFHKWADLFYGCSSYPMEVCLKVNGYNELFDGQKALDDVDFGNRLSNAGFNNFVIDKRIQVAKYEMENCGLNNINCKANHSILQHDKRNGIIRANCRAATMDDVESFMEKADWNPDYWYWKPDDPDFKLWFENQVIFDLQEIRRKNLEAMA
jgi:hypothetical protein